MKPIVVKRGLQQASNEQLARLWDDLAAVLQTQHLNSDGTLVPHFQEQFEAIRNEFARRGHQLQLF